MGLKLWFERGAWAARSAAGRAAAIEPEKVNNIAVIRHAAFGDMVLTRAFLRELRKHFPHAKITLSIVSNYSFCVPEDMVDRIHIAHGSDRRDTSLREQIRQLRALGYHDLIFDLASTSRSAWLCLLNPAKLKLGFPYHHLQRVLLYDAAVLRSDLKFELETMLEMLNLIGLKTDWPPCFDLTEEIMKRDRPYLVYFTTASTSGKCWSADRFSALIAKLADKYADYEHIVLEGVAAWESIDAVMAPLKNRTNVTPMKAGSLEQSIALLRGAVLLVSNDTGTRNLAIATETPTVGIFFSTVPYRYWPRYGQHDVVFTPDGSQPEVDAVFHSVDSLIQKIPPDSIS
ncbi:MAG TPA: glycosyltransferase family 9 protein [Gammaproteobacteria bacterium]|nr:glycosyltransferase family 9 protein [Gammaproteobacteria bacterium]